MTMATNTFLLWLFATGSLHAADAQTEPPTPFPTAAADCDASTPCGLDPSGVKQYCDYSFPSGQAGYCWSCTPSDGSRPYSSSCYGNGTLECMNKCFPDYICSQDEPCEGEGDGIWCTYGAGDTGLCKFCSGFESYPGLCSSNLFDASNTLGVEACKAACFPSCTSNGDCPDGFCTFENDGAGYCTSCKEVVGEYSTDGPQLCQNGTRIFTWTPAGEEACLAQCFNTCTDTEGCADPYPKGFCNRINGQDSEFRYCELCSLHDYDPVDCFWSINDPMSQVQCASTCYGECTLARGCSEGKFCANVPQTDASAGYCMECANVQGSIDYCFNRNTTQEGQEECAKTCFGACSEGNPCAEGSFCDFRNGQDGYCNQCEGGTHYEAIGCMEYPPLGQQSCATTCYQVCSDATNQTCPSFVLYSQLFCDYQLNSTTGVCADCPNAYDSPDRCKLWYDVENTTTLTEAGQESCIATCFRPCKDSSVEEDCGPNEICTNGYCEPDYSSPGSSNGPSQTTGSGWSIAVTLGLAITVATLAPFLV